MGRYTRSNGKFYWLITSISCPLIIITVALSVRYAGRRNGYSEVSNGESPPSPNNAPVGEPAPSAEGISPTQAPTPYPYSCLTTQKEMYDAVDQYFSVSTRDSVTEVYGPIEWWCFPMVTSLSRLFDAERNPSFLEGSYDFLLGWDMSLVEDTSFMFQGNAHFDGKGVENWNVSGVRNMAGMFQGKHRTTKLLYICMRSFLTFTFVQIFIKRCFQL